jgi:hypothetical protein
MAEMAADCEGLMSLLVIPPSSPQSREAKIYLPEFFVALAQILVLEGSLFDTCFSSPRLSAPKKVNNKKALSRPRLPNRALRIGYMPVPEVHTHRTTLRHQVEVQSRQLRHLGE